MSIATPLSGQHPSAPRQRESELLALIKANKLEPGVRALTLLLQDRLAKADEKLRTCSLDEFPATQARAAVYAQLLKEINT